jgi:aspartate--ammonia ligase
MLPKDYEPELDAMETQSALHQTKAVFGENLAHRLSLTKVSSPKFLQTGTGLQDDLAGEQDPVAFSTSFGKAEMIHSLAKWKRHKLGAFDVQQGQGIYTDMHAVRKDEDVSPIHSVHVDQWDWEQVLPDDERSLEQLKDTVRSIYDALRATEAAITDEYGLTKRLPETVSFVHAEDLERRYPEYTPKQREHAIAEQLGAVFIIGIGHPLPSGEPHDIRAADYDDWSTPTTKGHGLNGDLIVWDDIRDASIELSSMGVRVDADALDRQLDMHGVEHRKELPFHRAVLDDALPQTIGGGIGQSRVCMYVLQKAHIGEVQSSTWPDEVKQAFAQRGVPLL